MFLIVFVLICVVVGLYFYKNRKLFYLSWKLSGPLAFPIIGNALTFLCKNEDLLEKITSICRKYSSPIRLWFGPKFAVIITDVEQAQKILSSYNFIKKDPDMYKFLEPFDGQGLITSSGSKWRSDKRLISPKFAKRNIEQYFLPILVHTEKLIKLLKNKIHEPIFNIEPYIHRCTTDFINGTILGIETKAQYGEMSEFLILLHRVYVIIHARIVKVWLQNDLLFRLSSYWKEHEDGKKTIAAFIKKAIKNCNNTSENVYRPIINQLIDMRDEETGFCCRKDLIDHLITLYTASEDTITSIASFTLVLLGMYPNIQEKVVNEIIEIVGDKRYTIQENHLENLEYLDMVIKDVMRLFPIASFIVRETEKDFFLNEYLIPEECCVIISIFNIHRDERYWEKPNEFYPEHFLPEAVTKRNPYAFVPFSAGPRGCIGKNFAYMALKIMLVTVLQNFVIESEGQLEDIQLKTDIGIRPKDERFPVRLKLRHL